jgi:hypothetical protein
MSEPMIIAGRIASGDTYDRGSGKFRTLRIDPSTHAMATIEYEHHEAHGGSVYSVVYSVASVGALTNDIMTLSWTTPVTKEMHMTIQAFCSSGALLTVYEGKTGGGGTPTGVLPAMNHHRGSSKTSLASDVAGANVGSVSYDAAVFTGGTTLYSVYMGADGVSNRSVGGSHQNGQEFILAASTIYQVTLVEADTVPATLQMSWYEHTPKD